MADLFRRSDLQELIEHPAAPVVSIFLPTHRAAGSEQDPIRFKNLLDDAERRLEKDGMRAAEARALVAQGRELLDQGIFWSYQSDGLAVFLAPGWVRTFRVPLVLPELVVVNDRFHVTPLLDLLTFDRRFFVLALSQNEVRLLEGSRHSVQQVELGDVPTSLAEVLKYDDLEKEQQYHVAGRTRGSARAVFHGHGAGGEVDKVLLERWVRAVDDAVLQILNGETAPLVLAGVGYEQALYRAGTRYKRVLGAGIEGNPQQWSPAELHDKAWTLVEPVVAEARSAAGDAFLSAMAHGNGAAWDVEHVVAAAVAARVDTLFVPVGTQVWGVIDPTSGDVRKHKEREAGDEDLLDRAAVSTLLTGGTVHAVRPEQVPGPGPAAALLRY